MQKGYAAIIALAVLAVATVVVCTGFGPAGTPFFGLSGNDAGSLILFDVRLPRVIAAMLVGAGLFAEFYPKIKARFLSLAPLPAETLYGFLNLDRWVVIVIAEVVMIGILLLLAYLGW